MPHAAYLLGLRLKPVAKCSFASLTNGIFPVFFSTFCPFSAPTMFIQVSSNILRSRCLSFRCGVTVERQNEGRGRMYGKWVTRAESSALLLASSCPARALFLSCACLAPGHLLPNYCPSSNQFPFFCRSSACEL